MATTIARKRSTRPMSYYWGVVKDMDDSQKLELVTMLIESVKPTVAPQAMKRYSMDEINAMIDESERQIVVGETIADEELWRKYDEEFVAEEQQELELV